MNIINSKTTTPNCSQCSSPLILVSKITQQIEGVRYPQTTVTYRCSSEACQEEKDRETAKRIKVRDDRKLEADRRIEQKQQHKDMFKDS